MVGTASLRRRSQLLALRPDLDVRDVRGNVDTRLRKLAEGEYDAIVLAAAGLARLGRAEGAPIPEDVMTPAPGQGCLALEARADDERGAGRGRAHHRPRGAGRADRRARGGHRAGGDLRHAGRRPGALDGDRLALDAYAGLPDGSTWMRDALEGPAAEPAALGREVADRMLQAGARSC